MKITYQINIINRSITGVTGDQDELVHFDPIKFTATCTHYFEVVAVNSDVSIKDIYLRDSSNNLHATAALAASSGITKVRVACSTVLTKDDYHIDIEDADINVLAARIIILQDTGANDLLACECQFEVGDYTGEVWTATETFEPLPYPKYWYFDSAKWDGTITAHAEVVWKVNNSRYHLNVVLQEDDGSFGNWVTVKAIMYIGASETVIRTRSESFTLTSGRNYRLAFSTEDSKAGRGAYIYNAKVIVQQNAHYLVYLDEKDQNGYYYNVWGDGTFIYAVCDLYGLRSYSVDGSGNLTYINFDSQGASYRSVWGDGTFIYIAANTVGILSYSVDGFGNLTYIDFDYQGGNYRGVWGDGTFIYASCFNDGLRSYSVDGFGNLTYIDFDYQGGSYRSVWGNGTFIYVACGGDGLRSYSVDGSGNLTFLDEDDQGGDYCAVWGDGTFIYASCSLDGLRSYSVDGSGNLTYIDVSDTGGNYQDVWGDGDYIYTATYSDGIKSHSVDGFGNFTYLGVDLKSGVYNGVWGDGNFIYIAAEQNGLYSYEAKSEVITKLEPQMLLVNTGKTGTGLQNYDQLYDANEWDYGGGSLSLYPEHDALGAGANTKLQKDPNGTPSDIPNSSITGTNRIRGATALSIADDETVDTYIVNAGTYIAATKLVMQFNWATAGWTGKINGVTDPAKILGVAVSSISRVCGID